MKKCGLIICGVTLSLLCSKTALKAVAAEATPWQTYLDKAPVQAEQFAADPLGIGAEAVAQRHFGCSASELRRSDCALVAATLPNPIKFSSLSPSSYMRKRQKDIEKQMRHIPFMEGATK